MLVYIILSDWQVGLLAARSVHDLSVVALCLVCREIKRRCISCAMSCSAASDRFLRVLLREAEAACQKVHSRVRHFGTVFAFSVTKRGGL